MQTKNLQTCIATFARLDGQHCVDRLVWADAMRHFTEALNAKMNVNRLEDAVLDRLSWLLPIDCKLALLEKTRRLGCSSRAFMTDDCSYRAAYLEPDDPERAVMFQMLNDLNGTDQSE